VRSATRWSSAGGALGALALLVAAPAAAAGGRGADGDFEERSSSHFVLHQDVDIDESGGFHGSRRFEQNVLAALEGAYDSLDRLLGLRLPRKIAVVVYDPEAFDASFRGLFRFPAAGFYHGVIRVRGDVQVTYALQRVLHHELVHAALDAAAPSYVFPGWLNEGLAEWFEARALGQRGLGGREWGALRSAAAHGSLIPYAALSAPAFGHLGTERAALAYLQSYALIDHLARRHGERTLQELVDALVRSRDAERALRRVYRSDLAGLEAAFLSELR